MRIAIIVSYVSVDGSFGGPVAVATGHATELARRGHSVELIAGWDGVASVKAQGVRVKLFRARQILPVGFSGLVAPTLHSYLASHASRFDVIHIHMARDLITLPAALHVRARGRRLIIQTHGMVMPDSRVRAKLLDALATRRVLRSSSAVLALTEPESSGLRQVAAARLKIVRIPNGVRTTQHAPTRPNVAPQVLFLARLHPRKRVLAFAQMALLLIREGRSETFHVVGPDEGDLRELLAFIDDNNLSGRLVYEGPIASGASLDRLRKASVYVLPSVGEVFPMAVLESLSVGTPAVITADCGLASELRARGAAMVTDGTPESLATATRELLSNKRKHNAVADRGLQMVRSALSIDTVVDQLQALYEDHKQL